MPSYPHVIGLEGVLAKLETLSRTAHERIDRGAALAMARVILAEAKRLVPVYSGTDVRIDSGRLKKAILNVYAPELSGATRKTYIVTVRRGKRQRKITRGKKVLNLDAYYWLWVERGHYYVPPRGEASVADGRRMSRKAWREKHKGLSGAIWVAPRPFMRPAARNSGAAALQAAKEYYRTELAKLKA
jgi:hypothetical protein